MKINLRNQLKFIFFIRFFIYWFDQLELKAYLIYSINKIYLLITYNYKFYFNKINHTKLKANFLNAAKEKLIFNKSIQITN